MKLFLFLIGMVAAGLIGYSFEPDLRQQLTGFAPVPKKERAKRVVISTNAGVKKIDLASIPADQLPKKIVLKADAEVADASSDLKMTIPAGSRVSLVRLEGANAIISPGAGPFEGVIPISQTDLPEQVAAMPVNPTPEPVPVEAVVPEVTAPVVEPTEPEVAVVEPTPEETVVDPFAVPAVPAEPEMVKEPAEPEPELAAVVPDGPLDIVSVMQGSIKAGEIKEFTLDQVLDWKASEAPETIDGESYQTGIASYKAETVFGVKTIQAKALIKGGKVTRWLWPKSGMEIK